MEELTEARRAALESWLEGANAFLTKGNATSSREAAQIFSDGVDGSAHGGGVSTGSADVLLSISAGTLVKLIPSLSHYADEDRLRAALLVVRYAHAFLDPSQKSAPDETKGEAEGAPAPAASAASADSAGSPDDHDQDHDEREYERLVTAFGDDAGKLREAASRLQHGEDIFGAVDALFTCLVESLASVAVSIVAGAERFYLHPDPKIQGVGVTVAICLLRESDSGFAADFISDAIWNLYFFLDAATEASADMMSSGTRAVVCAALGRFSSQICVPGFGAGAVPMSSMSRSNAYSSGGRIVSLIVSRMLALPDKTASERAVTKDALARIFQSTRAQILAGSQPESLLPTFVDLLTAHNECHYDLLEWAVAEYIRIIHEGGRALSLSAKPPANAKSTASPKTARASFNRRTSSTAAPSANDVPEEVVKYVKVLMRYLRAKPDLMKLGAVTSVAAVLKIYGTSLMTNIPSLYERVVNGCAETHYPTANVFLHCLSEIANSSGLSRLAKLVWNFLERFDANVGRIPVEWRSSSSTASSSSSSLGEVLETAIRSSPALGVTADLVSLKELLRSVDYMSRVQRIRCLDLVQMWAGQLREVDEVFLHRILPNLQNEDAEVQRLSIAICGALAPAFAKAESPSNLGLVVSYLANATEGLGNRGGVDCFRTISRLPYERLGKDTVSRLFTRFARMVLTGALSPSARVQFYRLLSQEQPVPALSQQAVCLLVMCLGDDHIDGVAAIVDGLRSVSETVLGLKAFVDGFVDQGLLSRSLHKRILAFDIAADELLQVRAEAGTKQVAAVAAPLSSYIQTLEESNTCRWILDTMKKAPSSEVAGATGTVAAGSPSVGAPSPLRSPEWLAILFCKLGLTAADGSQSSLQLLFPAMSQSDMSLRRSTCLAAVRCCFSFGEVVFDRVAELLLIAAQFIASDDDAQQHSALLLFRLLVPLGIKDLNRFLVLTPGLVDLVLTYLGSDKVSSATRQLCIQVIKLLLLKVPLCMSPSFSLVQEIWRESFSINNRVLVSEIQRSYPLLYQAVSWVFLDKEEGKDGEESKTSAPAAQLSGAANGGGAEVFYKYLRGDLIPLADEENAWQIEGDALLSRLSSSQLRAVALSTIDALGCMEMPRFAEAIAIDVVPFLSSDDAELRAEALSALLAQTNSMKSKAKMASMRWAALPLCGDDALEVRRRYGSFETRSAILSAKYEREADDSPGTHPIKLRASTARAAAESDGSGDAEDEMRPKVRMWLERAHGRGSSQRIPTSLIRDVGAVIDEHGQLCDAFEYHHKQDDGDETTIDGASLVSAPAGPELMALVQRLSRFFCGSLAYEDLQNIYAHLQEMTKKESCTNSVPLVLAELVRAIQQYESDPQKPHVLSTLIVKDLLYSTSRTLTEETRSAVIHASIALKEIAAMQVAFVVPLVVKRAIQQHQLKEGDLVAVCAVLEAVTSQTMLSTVITVEQARALIERCLHILKTDLQTSDTAHNSCRLALDVVGSIVTLAGDSEVPNVVRAIVEMLEKTEDASVHNSASNQLQKMFSSLPSDHPIVKTITGEVLTTITSTDRRVRQTALTLFSLFASAVPLATFINIITRLVADPERSIRVRALQLVLRGEGHCPEAVHANVKGAAREALAKDSAGGPSRALKSWAASEANTSMAGSELDPVDVPDPKNLVYMQSAEYRGLLAMYGMPTPALEQESDAVGGGEEGEAKEGADGEAKKSQDNSGADAEKLVDSAQTLMLQMIMDTQPGSASELLEQLRRGIAETRTTLAATMEHLPFGEESDTTGGKVAPEGSETKAAAGSAVVAKKESNEDAAAAAKEEQVAPKDEGEEETKGAQIDDITPEDEAAPKEEELPSWEKNELGPLMANLRYEVELFGRILLGAMRNASGGTLVMHIREVESLVDSLLATSALLRDAIFDDMSRLNRLIPGAFSMMDILEPPWERSKQPELSAIELEQKLQRMELKIEVRRCCMNALP